MSEERLADFVSEIADTVCDICDALESHVPANVQRMLMTAKNMLRAASREYFSNEVQHD